MLLKYKSTNRRCLKWFGRLLLLSIAAMGASFLPAFAAVGNGAEISRVKPRQYANETAIHFAAGNGDSIAAFSGFFLAPENRQRAGSRLLKLHYVRFPAQTDKPRSPVLYLAGGPGTAGIDTAKSSVIYRLPVLANM